ncbi:MAG: hypothetical protein ACLR30_02565 [[Clostridium] leptum]
MCYDSPHQLSRYKTFPDPRRVLVYSSRRHAPGLADGVLVP